MSFLATLLAKPTAKWLIGGIAAVVVALVLAYVAYSLRSGGRDAERAAVNRETVRTLEDARQSKERTDEEVRRTPYSDRVDGLR